MKRIIQHIARMATTNNLIHNRNAPVYPFDTQTRHLSSDCNRDYIDYYTDWSLLSVRNAAKAANLLSKHKRRCTWCGGSGFTDCTLCTRGCWRCQRSTLIRCSFCNGFGDLDHPYNVQQREED